MNTNTASNAIVGCLSPGTKFSHHGQMYTLVEYINGQNKAVCLHHNTGCKYDFSNDTLVTPHISLLYTSKR